MHIVRFSYRNSREFRLGFRFRISKWIFIWVLKHREKVYFKNAKGLLNDKASRCFLWTDDVTLLEY